MKDYWLAKLISEVRKVDSRKRLQKSIYLLQFCKDFPLKFDYFLHYYGPYSFELASTIDQLNAADIIKEVPEPVSIGVRYSSSIAPKGEKVLDSFEQTDAGQCALNKIKNFFNPFERLNKENPWVLELAATVAYFHENTWASAQAQTETFKKVRADDSNLKKAVKIAKAFKN